MAQVGAADKKEPLPRTFNALGVNNTGVAGLYSAESINTGVAPV